MSKLGVRRPTTGRYGTKTPGLPHADIKRADKKLRDFSEPPKKDAPPMTDQPAEAIRITREIATFYERVWPDDRIAALRVVADLAERADDLAESLGIQADKLIDVTAERDQLRAYSEDVSRQLIAAWKERDAAREQVARLTGALIEMVNEKRDYMLLNFLGDPEQQHSIKRARKALSILQGDQPHD